jgi:DNA-binding NarL/FixJ family response regulator
MAQPIRTAIPDLHARTIVVLDDDSRFLNAAKRALSRRGFGSVTLVQAAETASRFVWPDEPDLLLVDIHLSGREDGLAFLRSVRARGFNRLAVVISGDSSANEFFRAAMAQANDFLVKSARLDLGSEVERVLSQGGIDNADGWRSRNVADLGYLRTIGLTRNEIAILTEFAVDFPRPKKLAERVQRAEGVVRRTFSRISEKLGIDNLSQLAHLVTVCGMYGRWSELDAETGSAPKEIPAR